MDSDLIIPPPPFGKKLSYLLFWALDLPIPHGPKAVLIAVLRRVDWATGRDCWASVATLSSWASLKERATRSSLNWLEKEGIVIAEKRPGKTTLYHIAPRQHLPDTPAAFAGVPRQHLPDTPAAFAYDTVHPIIIHPPPIQGGGGKKFVGSDEEYEALIETNRKLMEAEIANERTNRENHPG